MTANTNTHYRTGGTALKHVGASWPIVAFATLLFISLALAPSGAAHAELYAIIGQTGPADNNTNSTNRVLGWIFDINVYAEIQQLGLWDDDSAGLIDSHQVGVWNEAGTLLGSATIQAGVASPIAGPIVQGGSFRYESVAPIQLEPFNRYLIGALYNDNDDFLCCASSVSTPPEITFITEAFSALNSGFVMPDADLRQGLFGPNFAFFVTPEPTTGFLLCSVTFMLLGFQHRARRIC